MREGHTKLASSPPSPAYTAEKELATYKPADLGRNYEYYNGNAVFFLNGRLINSRQKPLNILTAFLAILPAVLFFVFSWVSNFLLSDIDYMLTMLKQCPMAMA